MLQGILAKTTTLEKATARASRRLPECSQMISALSLGSGVQAVPGAPGTRRRALSIEPTIWTHDTASARRACWRRCPSLSRRCPRGCPSHRPPGGKCLGNPPRPGRAAGRIHQLLAALGAVAASMAVGSSAGTGDRSWLRGKQLRSAQPRGLQLEPQGNTNMLPLLSFT